MVLRFVTLCREYDFKMFSSYIVELPIVVLYYYTAIIVINKHQYKPQLQVLRHKSSVAKLDNVLCQINETINKQTTFTRNVTAYFLSVMVIRFRCLFFECCDFDIVSVKSDIYS